MKALFLTEEIYKNNFRMFSVEQINTICCFPIMPEEWSSGDFRYMNNYSSLVDKHQEDGFLDLVIPEINENQKLGEIFFDEVNDNFTYLIEEKLIEIPQIVSQRQLRTQLALNGFDLNDVQAVIDSLQEPNKTIAQIAWDYALTFVRDDALLNSIASLLDISESDLDQIFINASKL